MLAQQGAHHARDDLLRAKLVRRILQRAYRQQRSGV